MQFAIKYTKFIHISGTFSGDYVPVAEKTPVKIPGVIPYTMNPFISSV